MISYQNTTYDLVFCRRLACCYVVSNGLFQSFDLWHASVLANAYAVAGISRRKIESVDRS